VQAGRLDCPDLPSSHLNINKTLSGAEAFLMSSLALLAANGQPSPVFVQPLIFLAIGLIFYFIVFLPNKRRQKALQDMLNNLKNGDKVITSGGIFGVVAGIKDDRIQLKVADQVKIEISKSAIVSKQSEE
jgi:preprotein translocase subunit YajC